MWINLEGIMLSEISQTEKDKHFLFFRFFPFFLDFTYMWNLKNRTNQRIFFKKKQTHT